MTTHSNTAKVPHPGAIVPLCIGATMHLANNGHPGYGKIYAAAIMRGLDSLQALWAYFKAEWPAAADIAQRDAAGLLWGE